MIEDAAQHPLSPYEYAIYLDNMSNDAFWDHAKALAAHSSRPMQMLAPLDILPKTTLSCVTCLLREGGSCVLPFVIIREILPVSQHITRLPDVPPWVIGVLSWRGETMPAIDLCAYLAQKELTHPHERITLITKHEDTWLALCVLGINETPAIVDVEHVVSLSPSVLTDNENIPPLRGIVGLWEMEESIGSKNPLVLDIPLMFKDIMQRIEKRDINV